MQRPLPPDLLYLLLQRRYPVTDQPPVRLQLRLARPARADSTLQPLQVRPLAPQAGQDVFVLGQLHLQPALPRARVLGEDVQDQRRAIQHLHLQLLLKRPLLGWRQLIVEDDGGVVQRALLRGDLLHLAPADVRRRVGPIQPLQGVTHHLRPRRDRQKCQLLQRGLRTPAPMIGRPVRPSVAALDLGGHQERALLGLRRLV